MSRIVLDSSAILAVIYREPGAAKVESLLNSDDVEPIVSAVNVCEVHTRLLRDGLSNDDAAKLLANLKLTVVTFEEGDAYAAGALYPQTRTLGLSLGDRACLALALGNGSTVWTADRLWKRLKLNVEIELIRI